MCEGDDDTHDGGGHRAVFGATEGVGQAEEGLPEDELQVALVVRTCWK